MSRHSYDIPTKYKHFMQDLSDIPPYLFLMLAFAAMCVFGVLIMLALGNITHLQDGVSFGAISDYF